MVRRPPEPPRSEKIHEHSHHPRARAYFVHFISQRILTETGRKNKESNHSFESKEFTIQSKIPELEG